MDEWEDGCGGFSTREEGTPADNRCTHEGGGNEAFEGEDKVGEGENEAPLTLDEHIVCTLALCGQMTTRELAGSLNVPISSATHALYRMKRNGLVDVNRTLWRRV